MKILLVCNEENKASAERLEPFFAGLEIPLETFALTPQNYMDIGRITGILVHGPDEHPSHVFIVPPLSASWMNFLSGFACGSKIPFLLLGDEKAAGIHEAIAFCFKAFGTEEALLKYLLAEKEVYREKAEARVVAKARETLLDMGIPLTEESLAQCAAEGRIAELTLFFTAGFLPDARDRAGVPLLCIAARNGNRAMLSYLVSSGAGVNLQSDDRGSTPLIDGVMGNCHDIVHDLVKAGADLNIKTKDGQTALIVAVGAGNEIIVETLLEAGADPDITDNLGVSARKYAALFHNNSIMSLFNNVTPQREAQ